MKLGALMKRHSLLLLYRVLVFITCGAASSNAQTYVEQRINSAGNWSVRVQNNGTFYNRNVPLMLPGGLWQDPTGFVDSLIFGGGIWVGAIRRVNGVLTPAVSFSYEPNAAGDLCVPGSTIFDGLAGDTAAAAVDKYRVYRSDDLVGPAWPMRMTSKGPVYIDDTGSRVSAGAPYVVGDEDMFTIYKDSDPLQQQIVGTELAAGVEIRSQLSFWKLSEGKDVIVVHNTIIHTSDDTLFDPVVALALDGDVNLPDDDRLKGVEDEGVHAAVFFTDRSKTDPFLGVVLLAGQHNSRRFDPGLSGLLYWDISEDPTNDSDRYNFLSTERYDTATSKVGDARLLMASGSSEPLVGRDTLYFDYALFAMASQGRSALDPIDSARLLDFATEITNDYRGGNLSQLMVPVAPVEFPGPSSLSVYPNPASDRVTINVKAQKGAMLGIFDMLGREWKSVRVGVGECVESFDLSNLPTGIYFANLSGEFQNLRFLHVK
jgi:hypothetical protein